MSTMHHFGRWFDSDANQRRIALKGLYREVAKRVHPDLTSDETDRNRRQRLMAEANQAFQQGDAQRLAKILEDSDVRPESVQESDAPVDLARAVRKITLKSRLHLTFMERFDNDRMKGDRRLLAENLLGTAPPDKIPQDIMNFFEEMHLFLNDCYLNEALIWSTFGFASVRWWAVCEDYVFNERKRRNDSSLFAGFQDLAARFSKRDAQAGFKEPTIAELIVFLEDERKLASD
jgi:hypothetical protein